MPENNPQQPTRPRKWKRTAVIALLLLIGGAVVNVAVAWGRAATLDWRIQVEEKVPADRSIVDWWAGEAPEGFPDAPTLMGERRRLGYRRLLICNWDRERPADAERVDAVRRLVEDSDREHVFVYCASRYQHGWPALSLEWSGWWIDDYYLPDWAYREIRGAVELSFLNPDPVLGYPKCALHPLWTGFIINTLFYALLLWLLFFAPFTARRMLRRRRGKCEKCAYPIGLSPVCTECGAAVLRKVEA